MLSHKKVWSFLFLSAVLLSSYSASMDLPLDFNGLSANMINSVRISSCDESLSGVQSLRPGQKKTMCLAIVNRAETPVMVDVELVSANHVPGTKISCGDKFSNSPLSGLLETEWGTSPVFISGLSLAKKNIVVAIPESFSGGTYPVCVIYKINTKSPTRIHNMFDIVVRKELPFQISVSGAVYRFSAFDDFISIFIENRVLLLRILLGVFVLLLVYTILSSLSNSKKSIKHKK